MAPGHGALGSSCAGGFGGPWWASMIRTVYSRPTWCASVLVAASVLLGDYEAKGAEVGIGRDRDTVQVTIRGEDGREYSLEAAEALLNEGARWKSVATVAPAGNRPAVVLDPTCSTAPQNFYRLRLLQGSVPVEVPNFRLLAQDGRAHELFYQSDARGVVLVLAGADLAGLGSLGPEAVAHLNDLHTTYGGQGFRIWVLADATARDRARLRERVRELGLHSEIPILEDEGGTVTRVIGGGQVPEVVAVQPGGWSIFYRGRLRDAVPAVEAGEGVGQLLEEALKSRWAGRPVVVRRTAVAGSVVSGRDFGGTSYARDIAPLLQRQCVPCHSPGNIAPWAMTNHAVVREYAPLMKDEILTRRMPPWHADRNPQSYSNDGMLSGEEMALLVDWIDRGAPRDEGMDPLAEAVPPAPPEWPLGVPDRVVTLARQSIPATGSVDYRYLLVANPFPNDVWLRAAVVKPGNPKVVHHALVFSATGFADILQVQAGLGGYFAAYVPGMGQAAFPEGTGKLLKRGAVLVFQMHYTVTGKPETDATEIGLYVATVPPGGELRTAAAYDTQFTIPPGAADHVARAEFTLPYDAWLHEMSPHMHYRGRWFRIEAVHPDDRRETLLHVPFYRFDWQTLYRLSAPRRLPAGTRIVATGGWDNSARNPYNPDPGSSVRFGEQSWEEMFIGYFNFSPAN